MPPSFSHHRGGADAAHKDGPSDAFPEKKENANSSFWGAKLAPPGSTNPSSSTLTQPVEECIRTSTPSTPPPDGIANRKRGESIDVFLSQSPSQSLGNEFLRLHIGVRKEDKNDGKSFNQWGASNDANLNNVGTVGSRGVIGSQATSNTQLLNGVTDDSALAQSKKSVSVESSLSNVGGSFHSIGSGDVSGNVSGNGKEHGGVYNMPYANTGHNIVSNARDLGNMNQTVDRNVDPANAGDRIFYYNDDVIGNKNQSSIEHAHSYPHLPSLSVGSIGGGVLNSPSVNSSPTTGLTGYHGSQGVPLEDDFNNDIKRNQQGNDQPLSNREYNSHHRLDQQQSGKNHMGKGRSNVNSGRGNGSVRRHHIENDLSTNNQQVVYMPVRIGAGLNQQQMYAVSESKSHVSATNKKNVSGKNQQAGRNNVRNDNSFHNEHLLDPQQQLNRINNSSMNGTASVGSNKKGNHNYNRRGAGNKGNKTNFRQNNGWSSYNSKQRQNHSGMNNTHHHGNSATERPVNQVPFVSQFMNNQHHAMPVNPDIKLQQMHGLYPSTDGNIMYIPVQMQHVPQPLQLQDHQQQALGSLQGQEALHNRQRLQVVSAAPMYSTAPAQEVVHGRGKGNNVMSSLRMSSPLMYAPADNSARPMVPTDGGISSPFVNHSNGPLYHQSSLSNAPVLLGGVNPSMSFNNNSGASEGVINGFHTGGGSVGGSANSLSSSRPPLSSLLGHVRRLSRDQVGCRLLQQSLDEDGPVAATAILQEGIPFLAETMTDPFGNYLFQKVLEKVNDEERLILIQTVAPRLVNASLNLHGTRSVQKIMDVCSTNANAALVVTQALAPAAARLCIDSHGNHVIQRILSKLPHEYSKFVFDAVANSVGDVARHRHGCCVIQRCLDSPSSPARSNLVRRIVERAVDLMQDAYGNYVVQYVLDACHTNNSGCGNIDHDDDAIASVCQAVVGKVCLLAIQKFSSNVMEKCLERSSDRVRESYLLELSDSSKIRELMNDPFGNYVVQRALSVATHVQAVRLVEAMRPHLNIVMRNNSAGGRRILAKICRRFPSFAVNGGDSDTEAGPVMPNVFHQSTAHNQFSYEVPRQHGSFPASTGGQGLLPSTSIDANNVSGNVDQMGYVGTYFDNMGFNGMGGNYTTADGIMVPGGYMDRNQY